MILVQLYWEIHSVFRIERAYNSFASNPAFQLHPKSGSTTGESITKMKLAEKRSKYNSSTKIKNPKHGPAVRSDDRGGSSRTLGGGGGCKRQGSMINVPYSWADRNNNNGNTRTQIYFSQTQDEIIFLLLVNLLSWLNPLLEGGLVQEGRVSRLLAGLQPY